MRLRGRLLYHAPVGHVLCGYVADTSAFTRGQFTITAFAQVMAVPAEHLTLSFGHRLSKGLETSWTLNGANDDAIARDVVSLIQAEERSPARVRTLEDFVARYMTPGDQTADLRIDEAIFYSLILLRRDSEAMAIAARMRTPAVSPPWVVELLERTARDAADLLVDRRAVEARITRQEEATRAALKLV